MNSTPGRTMLFRELKLAGKPGISLVGLDLYLEIRGGTSGKVDSFDGAGPFIEWDAIGAISAVKPNGLWAQRVCLARFGMPPGTLVAKSNSR
jgi:hypothetical protein